MTGYAVSTLKALFIFSTFWLGLALLRSMIRSDLDRTDLARNLFFCSLPFSIFFLSWIDLSLSMQVLLFSFFLRDPPFFQFSKHALLEGYKGTGIRSGFFLVMFLSYPEKLFTPISQYFLGYMGTK